MIKINGKVYQSNNVSIINNKVIVDGVVIDLEKSLTVNVEGNIESLNVDACNSVTVAGTVCKLKTTSGNVKCGDVAGDVNTMSGDVDAKIIHGSVETMSGDIST